MCDPGLDEAVKAAAGYLTEQHRKGAVIEAKMGRRHAEIVGDAATVEAFDAMLAYLQIDPPKEASEMTGMRLEPSGTPDG